MIVAKNSEMHAPPFDSLLRSGVDSVRGDILLQFHGEDNQNYRVQFRRELAGIVMAAITEVHAKSLREYPPENPKESTGQPLDYESCQTAVYAHDRGALVFRLEGGIKVIIVLDHKKLSDLLAEISKLHELIKPATGTTPKH